MNSENTKRIIDACPSLFVDVERQRDNMAKGIMFNPIAFGFECGDGWAELLVELCQKIQLHLNTLTSKQVENILVLQVKEKYGTLRFYVSVHDDVLEKYIRDAEEKSANTCEVCGKPGKVLGEYWLFTACDEHNRE
jgi:hypothetical protein